MKQVTLRLPVAGHERLLQMSERYGVSFRAIFEAAIIIGRDRAGDPQMEAMWESARRLEESAEFRTGPRRKIIARLDDDLALWLAEECRRRGVSQNATFGLLVLRDGGLVPTAEEVRRLFELARHLDFKRRSPGRPGAASEAGRNGVPPPAG